MKKYIVIAILAGIAFVNASYLTFKSYAPATNTFCDINAVRSCSTVLSNPASKIGGVVAFPAVAMIVYPFILSVALVAYKFKSPKLFKLLAIVSGAGILFNTVFIYIETMIIKSFCPLCILCTGLVIAIFILSIMGYRQYKNI